MGEVLTNKTDGAAEVKQNFYKVVYLKIFVYFPCVYRKKYLPNRLMN